MRFASILSSMKSMVDLYIYHESALCSLMYVRSIGPQLVVYRLISLESYNSYITCFPTSSTVGEWFQSKEVMISL